MKVLLKEDVKNLGIMGNIVDVADGYGRNYLLPRNLAVEANKKNVKSFEHEKKIVLEKAKKVKSSAEEFANKLSGTPLTITANAGEDNKLFGSVTSMDIADALAKQGMDVDKRKIILDEPIKRIGKYVAHVKVHPDVTADINLEITPAEGAESSGGAKKSEE